MKTCEVKLPTTSDRIQSLNARAHVHAIGDIVLMDDWNAVGVYGIVVDIIAHEVYAGPNGTSSPRYTYDVLNGSQLHKDVAAFRIYDIDRYETGICK